MTLLLAILMTLAMTACGRTSNNSTETPEQITPAVSGSITLGREYDESDPVAVLSEITNDFADVISLLIEKQEETFSAVGTTYEDYQKNKGLVDEWVNLVLAESDSLFARTRENSIIYFKLIAADPDHKYSEFCDEALEEYYDTVYDEALDEYYDNLYDDAMDALYDEYYDGIIDDAYDDVEYSEWSNASSECYKTWSNASSAVYKKWSNESSYIYGLWSAMSSAFCWNDNYDVDGIIEEYDAKKAAEDVVNTEEESKAYVDSDALYESTESTTPTEPTQNTSTADGIRPEFKEAMDSYEAFYTEYCEFMMEYSGNPTDLKLLAQYADMLAKAEEVDKAFEAWDEDDLNNEELKYYLDVNTRVMKMLVDIAG